MRYPLATSRRDGCCRTVRRSSGDDPRMASSTCRLRQCAAALVDDGPALPGLCLDQLAPPHAPDKRPAAADRRRCARASSDGNNRHGRSSGTAPSVGNLPSSRCAGVLACTTPACAWAHLGRAVAIARQHAGTQFNRPVRFSPIRAMLPLPQSPMMLSGSTTRSTRGRLSGCARALRRARGVAACGSGWRAAIVSFMAGLRVRRYPSFPVQLESCGFVRPTSNRQGNEMRPAALGTWYSP